jgi:UPF0755 protein
MLDYKKILQFIFIHIRIASALVALFVFLNIYFFFIIPPANFPIGRVIEIEAGRSIGQVAGHLYTNNVVRSPMLFKFLAKMTGNGRIIAGDYFFTKPRSIFSIVSRLSQGRYGLEPFKFTVTEGASVQEIGDLLEKNFQKFDKQEFLRQAASLEGFLFPDTYYFLPTITPESAISAMTENFYKKIDENMEELGELNRPLHDIVIMASLLEKEARDKKTRQMIAGILWKRLEIDMPLQVDAVFLYINGKNTYELSVQDLRENNSPYNTYKYKGLPPGPIGNPGLESIYAAVHPEESDYLYYLADRAGNTYYARTFDEHKVNKQKHIY